SVPTYLEPFCKVVDKRGDLATPGKFDGFLFPVRELLDQEVVLDLDIGNGIATDIGKTVVVGMVVTALQEKAVGKTVPDLEVDAHRGDGVRQDLFVMGLQGIVHRHLLKIKKACRDDRPLVWL